MRVLLIIGAALILSGSTPYQRTPPAMFRAVYLTNGATRVTWFQHSDADYVVLEQLSNTGVQRYRYNRGTFVRNVAIFATQPNAQYVLSEFKCIEWHRFRCEKRRFYSRSTILPYGIETP